MSEIRLEKIITEDNRVSYIFSYSTELSKYFTDNEFFIEYPQNIESVPKGILAIPFTCNVLPIIWLTNSTLYLPFIDKDFYNSITEFKKGYIEMYPNADFSGFVISDVIEENIPENASRSASFFSGGLDATVTLLRNIDQKPDLISIWGSDIKVDNTKGWAVINKGLTETAHEYGLKLNIIKSSFREFDSEKALNSEFSSVLNDNWWHGVKHSIGLISHAAPYAWLNNIKTLYIASSYSPESGKHTCASYPTIDNFVKFCGCSVIHDAFEMSRQDKVNYLINYCKKTGQKAHLHVCWQSQSGNNCCKCEKCYRTIMGIIAGNHNPENYGFSLSNTTFAEIETFMTIKFNYTGHSVISWNSIKKQFIKNWNEIEKTSYAPHVRWILNFDFENYKKYAPRKKYQRKEKIRTLKENISLKFPKFYSFYCKLTGKQP